MQTFEQVRYALRQFRKAPGFTITAVLTLALGIGATTAIFTLVHAVLLKSLPVTRPEQLVRVGNEENCCVNGGMQDNWSLFSWEQYRQFKEQTSGFEELAAFQAGSSLLGVRRSDSPKLSESFRGEFVSGNYFSTFGIPAYAGRMISPQDDIKGAPPVAIMSFRAWQQKFAGDRSVVGAAFVINSQPVTVVGIAPPGFFGDRIQSNPTEFWLPLTSEPVIEPANAILDEAELDWLDLIGRVKPGADQKAMEAQMQVLLRQFLLSPISKVEERSKSLVPKQTLHFSPGGNGLQRMRDEYQDGLHLLMWVSGFVLLIGCGNLANLMLVRATARKQQIALRSALGAQRRTLILQALTESVVLALMGGIAGIGVAFAGTRMILRLTFGHDYVPITASPSLTVLFFAFAVSVLTGILFGMAPAWLTARTQPADALRGAGRSIGGRAGWGQKALVITQAALSLVLLCAAGLLTRSLTNMQHRHFGFETAHRYILHIDPQMAGYSADKLEPLYRQVKENLSALPGVQQVAFSIYSPMEGDNWGEGVYIDGDPPPAPGDTEHGASWLRASPNYFEAIGTKILEGRGFTEQDSPSTRAVALVNRFFEQKYFKDGHAVGKYFSDDLKHPGAFEIVGVTEDTNYWGASSKMRPMYFLAQGQSARNPDPQYQRFEDRSRYLNAIVIETRGEISGLETQVRRVLSQINPDLAVIDFQSFAVQVAMNFLQQEMITKLTSLFGLLALVLASIGLYGVTAYSVEQRTSEIGIRMALGADRLNMLAMILRGAFLQVGIGLAIGLPAIILGGRLMASKLYGVKHYDPFVLVLTTVVLSLAAFAAALIPARRAANTEPMLALRTE
ncbi:MAG TPA: ABC transporter permease [Candidatus Limnocylindrales bacterium]|nr:ABC transporter permease [Candidatus Limnocylindrales bacterium]